ncbi:MAG: hypothetical protein AB7L28_27635, partial [Kofleriaceae bacterium]
VQPTKPISVPPNAVTKVSGELPRIVKYRHDDLPTNLSTLVCIDTAGNVTSVKLVTKISGRAAADVPSALRGWKYTPYRRGGVAVPACFVVSFRIQ